MGPVRAIFFDIGDTLVFDDPPLPARLWCATQSLGLPLEKERWPAAYRAAEEYALAQYLGGAALDDAGLMRESASRALAHLGAPPLEPGQWLTLREAFIGQPFRRRIHPGALGLLEELRARGFIVGAISDWEETLSELLAELALAPHLDALAVSAIVGVTKPDPRLFREALRQARVRPEESIHIGDWYELDVAGARAAGMTGLLFDGRRRRPDADCPRVETFDELTRLLLALPGA